MTSQQKNTMVKSSFWKRVRIALFAMAIVGVLVPGCLLLSIRSQPEFYRESLKMDPVTIQRESESVTKKIADLQSKAAQPDTKWATRISDTEINALIASTSTDELKKSVGNLIKDPRIAIHADRVELACQFEGGPLSGVLHLSASVQMQKTNLLAVRVRDVHLGAVPFSRDQAFKLAYDAMKGAGTKVSQGSEGGDPVLLIQLDPKTQTGLPILFDSIVLEDGNFHFSGKTGKGK